jgi:RimJ/RimL family protein N-acetyltransferase
MVLEIETDRLRLRQFTPDDLDDVARLFANPAVMRFMGVAGETHSRAEAEKALHSIIAHWGRYGFGRWAVIYKNCGKLIGYGGLRSFRQNAELVYLLDQPYWGRGLATELANACLRFGFDSQLFDQIMALSKPENMASRRVLEKIGMSHRGSMGFFRLMAEAGMSYLRNGEADDVKVSQYFISRAEFQSQSI